MTKELEKLLNENKDVLNRLATLGDEYYKDRKTILNSLGWTEDDVKRIKSQYSE